MEIASILSQKEVNSLMKAVDKLAEEYKKEEREVLEKIKKEIENVKSVEEILKIVFKRVSSICIKTKTQDFSLYLVYNPKSIKVLSDGITSGNFGLVIEVNKER